MLSPCSAHIKMMRNSSGLANVVGKFCVRQYCGTILPSLSMCLDGGNRRSTAVLVEVSEATGDGQISQWKTESTSMIPRINGLQTAPH